MSLLFLVGRTTRRREKKAAALQLPQSQYLGLVPFLVKRMLLQVQDARTILHRPQAIPRIFDLLLAALIGMTLLGIIQMNAVTVDLTRSKVRLVIVQAPQCPSAAYSFSGLYRLAA
jgi:hypothetical protein